MRPLFIWLLFLLVSFPHEAGAFLDIGDATISWDEDVLTKDGQILVVHRTVTHGKDSRWGSGILKEQSISFSFDGHNVKWINNDIWPIIYMPDILDIVNGIPVLVMPVHRWGPCEKYGFPPEGLAAFGYKNGHWARIAVTDLPKDLKVNLLRTTHDIRYCKSDIGEKVTPSYKLKREKGSNWGAPEQGVTISEASKYYNDFKTTEDSCVRIRPAPNPQLDACKQNIAEAEANAKPLVATLASSLNKSEAVSSEDYRKAKGKRISETCKDTVEQIEPLRLYYEGGGWQLVGYTLVLKNGNQIPIQQPNIKKFQAPDQLETVTCDKKTIYTVKRHGKKQLIIHRFSHTGSLIDALNITLAEIDEFFPEKKWPMLWEFSLGNKQINITVADYSYTKRVHDGGQLEQRQNYIIRLPNE